jgi:hypothetical protein
MENCLQPKYWHPLKGPCQEETLLHRKKGSFFCRDIIQYEISPLLLPASGFSKFIGADSYSICCQAPIRIKASERKSKNCRLRSGEIFIIS